MAYFVPAFTLRDRDGDCRLVEIKPDECAILHVVSPPFLRLGASLSGAIPERRMPRKRPLNQSAHTAFMGSNVHSLDARVSKRDCPAFHSEADSLSIGLAIKYP